MMRNYIKKMSWSVFLLLAPLFIMASTASAAEFWIRAGSTTLTMPDNEVVTVWGYALDEDDDFSTVDGTITSPGPLLEVPPGDTTLMIHLKNDLPEPTCLVIPGQMATMTPVWNDGSSGSRPSLTARVRSFTSEVAENGGEATYAWNNVKPGTYLYQSGTHPAVQVQMGLFGGLKKDFGTGLVAYEGIYYNRESILIFSEIDPLIHNAVATGNFGPAGTVTSTISYSPKYFLLNGRAELFFTGIVPEAFVGERILIRMLNAGLRTRAPVILGSFNYMNIVAEDGNMRPYTRERRLSLNLYAGKTMDVYIDIHSSSSMGLYDRRGFVSVGAAEGTGTPTGQTIVGLAAIPSGTTTIQQPTTGDGGGGGCFISTLF
ncbi:MAG: multicopper oxidase domain-containing protein [Deltaproteobacteria bacterium]|nr:multicopper oxidase domain-containing protein [Deltaproteobacteria bacterium]MBW2142203.1 multicopper oxidase domain-containing protein [Deltaproteobacteria bacterium]